MAKLSAHILSSLKFGAENGREAEISRHVPYLRHVEEDMLKTKEGHFLMVVKVGGFCFQTADQAEIDMRLSSRNTLIRSMNDSRFAVYSHIIRREVTPEIGGGFDNFFCAELDRRYMANQAHKRMFVNDLYVTIIRRGFQGKVGMADKATSFFRKGLGVDEKEIEREATAGAAGRRRQFLQGDGELRRPDSRMQDAPRGRLHGNRRVPGAAAERRSAASHGAAAHGARRLSADEAHYLRQEGS